MTKVMTECHFWIPGIPKPGGSKRAFIVKTKAGPRAVVTDANPNVKDWKDAVLSAAREHAPPEPATCAMRLDVHFNLPRPRSHYGTGKNDRKLKAGAPFRHTQKPDRTKLLRPLEDAMRGIFWRDDCQVVAGDTTKEWAISQPGAAVTVTYLEPVSASVEPGAGEDGA